MPRQKRVHTGRQANHGPQERPAAACQNGASGCRPGAAALGASLAEHAAVHSGAAPAARLPASHQAGGRAAAIGAPACTPPRRLLGGRAGRARPPSSAERRCPLSCRPPSSSFRKGSCHDNAELPGERARVRSPISFLFSATQRERLPYSPCQGRCPWLLLTALPGRNIGPPSPPGLARFSFRLPRPGPPGAGGPTPTSGN